MVSKIFTALSTIFIIRTLTSCFCPCHLYDTYGIYYKEVEITTSPTSDSTNGISRYDFTINLKFSGDTIQISSLSPQYMHGFSNALACDCDGDTYLIDDPVDNIEILVIDEKSSESMKLNTLSTILPPRQNELSLEEFFYDGWGWVGTDIVFHLDPSEAELLPATAVFQIEVQLESGLILTDQTQPVNFID
ncbi:MAG: hypothetical protein AAGE93_16910 [Bacteroidota bacterium]